MIAVGVVTLMLLIPLLAASHNALAFGELDNLESSISPSSACPSSNAHLSITIYNYNNRSLDVNTVDLQIYASSDAYTHYHVFTGNQSIPSGGDYVFGLDAKLPNYMGQCGALITVSGALEGDSNLPIGLTTSSIFLDPTLPSSSSILIPLIAIGVIAVVVAIAVIAYIVFRMR